MPRGNDARSAAQDLQSQYGDHDSAEGLIRAHDAAYDQNLLNALQKPVSVEATAALDFDSIEPSTDGGTIIDAAVRGGMLVVVEDTEEGRRIKWATTDHPGIPKTDRRRSSVVGTNADPVVPVPAPAPPSPTGASPANEASGSTADEAPENVRVADIREALDKAQVTVPSDARTKDALWALAPNELREQLIAASSGN